MGATSWRWIPKLPDAVIPFLFGLTQGVLIYGIDFKSTSWWYFAMSAVCVVSFLAYFNMYNESKRLYQRNKIVLELQGKLPRLNEIAILVFAGMFFFFGVFEVIWGLNSIYLAALSLVFILVWIVRGSVGWKRVIEPKQIERW